MKANKNWKAVEFTLLLLCSIFMTGLLFNKLSVERIEILGELSVYECELWKDSTVIYTHRVKLDSGEKYFVRTKGIKCDDIASPKVNEPVSLIVEDKTIVSLSQDDREILKYEILANDSEKNSSIIWFVTILLAGASVWSGYQLRRLIQTDRKS
jgi:hypothetical protein